MRSMVREISSPSKLALMSKVVRGRPWKKHVAGSRQRCQKHHTLVSPG
jgi:hypothetical protein